jgi:hypothetical protein
MAVNKDPKPILSHKEYVVERSKRLNHLFTSLAEDDARVEQFRSDPARVAREHGLTLTDEEVFGIQSLRHFDLANVYERLTLSPVAVFNANCSCAMPTFSPGER